MNDTARDDGQASKKWWRTGISDIKPGSIRYHGYAIQDLIGNIGFAQMIWLMLRGELPAAGQGQLLEAALMSAVDHGPQAPSIAISRMAMTCGVSLNNAMASAVNVLGDVHGGAGEQAVALYKGIAADIDAGTEEQAAVSKGLDAFIAQHGKYISGFGHRFHPVDPRAGRYAVIARAIEQELHARKGKAIPMNIDGATAVIYAELDFQPALARGLFCLSRSVGILAHAWEQSEQGGRNKGPIPRQYLPAYDGHPPRDFPKES
jgi:citrate synthase